MINLGFEKFKKKNSSETQEDDIRFISHEKSVVIDGLTYQIDFSSFFPTTKNGKEFDLDMYSLNFNTKEHHGAITNKGVMVFNELTKEIKKFFDEINSETPINAVVFSASNMRLNSEEEAKTREIGRDIEKKLLENNHLLDGFSKEQDGKKITIENGYLNLEGNFQKPGSFSMRALAEEIIKIPDMPDWFKPAVWYFIDRDSIEDKTLQKATDISRKGSELRLALYTRFLKRDFPEYEFERIHPDYPKVVIYTNKEKKDVIRQAMLEMYDNTTNS